MVTNSDMQHREDFKDMGKEPMMELILSWTVTLGNGEVATNLDVTFEETEEEIQGVDHAVCVRVTAFGQMDVIEIASLVGTEGVVEVGHMGNGCFLCLSTVLEPPLLV
jgi:hypothetical protein